MTTPLNRQIVLARRPTGAPRPDDFMLIESPVPRPGDGQMLCRTIYLSLDPYMRGRMSEGRSYAKAVDLGRPRSGETVVVSAASGAVGSVVGQIAKLKGCRAVGIAGSEDKCRFVVDTLGFDACVSHRTSDLVGALRLACPSGIDVYFENVGGPVLDAVLRLVNPGARIPLCGLISQYNATEPVRGPDLRPVLVNRVSLRGFIVSDHADRQADFLTETTRWVREGRVRYREDVVDGLEQAPRALIGLLEGRNFGKVIVRVGPAPAGR